MIFFIIQCLYIQTNIYRSYRLQRSLQQSKSYCNVFLYYRKLPFSLPNGTEFCQEMAK